MSEIKRCSRCVMDNSSDTTISFDAQGRCNYCTKALQEMGKVYFPNVEGERRLNKLLNEIKESGKGKKYDCIMGLSGGLDSSYLAYLGHKWGLRILAVHIDDGYDTEISKGNLEKLVNRTGFDYEIITPDPEQFNDLTLAFMKAGVPNIATPQDNVLFAFLYRKMKEYKIEYFLSGYNFALESILQKGNSHSPYDVVNILNIHKKYGKKGIDKLEFISDIQRSIDKRLYHIKTVYPLNDVEYNREKAFRELKDFCGFNYYGRKHLENKLTAFIQLVWFPQKFGVDKRTSHLSSMIVSGQMTRENALKELAEPLYDKDVMDQYIALIKQKMHLSDDEFDQIMHAGIHQHNEYRTEDDTLRYKAYRKLLKWLGEKK